MNRKIANDQLECIYENLKHGVDNGVLHLTASKLGDYGETVQVDDSHLVNFSSYSYLGLERNEQLVEACVNAARNYGTQFGYSRAFISVDLYDELEALLSKIFEASVILSPSTTLAHQSAMPVVMYKTDLLIIDQFAHASMYYSAKGIRDSGAKMEVLRHNRMVLLRDRLKETSQKYEKVWYIADGVYSMQGDYAPVQELYELMEEYPNFHVYIDDAHGMSWCGDNGKGYVLNQIDLHEQMVLVTSLNKAFASAGGVIAVKSPELRRKIRTCGGTMIFSTPIQPPMLGVGIASAKLHLSEEINARQKKLNDNIQFCKEQIQKTGLPEISASDSPVFFVPTAYPKLSYEITKSMRKCGFFLTPVLYPAVSMRRSGIRFCITVNHTFEEIQSMIELLRNYYLECIETSGYELTTILNYFKIPVPQNLTLQHKNGKNGKNSLSVNVYRSINEIAPTEWNEKLGDFGMFDANALRFLENSFSGNAKKEDNWDFHYLIIREADKPILMTFFTKCWCKDDIFKSEAISKEIETLRHNNPYYLVTESLMMGSMITEGNHLYIDRSSDNWQKSLDLMLKWIDNFQQEHNINSIYLRDFDYFDFDLSEKLLAHGLVEIDLPDYSHIVDMDKYADQTEWWSSLSSKKRQSIKKDVIAHEHEYTIDIKECVSLKELQNYYELYKSVKQNNLALNTFDLPFKFFENLNNDPNWEIMVLTISECQTVGAVVFSYKSTNNYIPLVMGINYDVLHTHKVYKQALYRMVKRGQHIQARKIMLGITSSLNKRRLGAIAVKKKVYVSMQDMYNAQVLSHMTERE